MKKPHIKWFPIVKVSVAYLSYLLSGSEQSREPKKVPGSPAAAIYGSPLVTVARSSVKHRIRYESWLAGRGLMLSPFHVRWQTTMFNRLFAYCARINPRAQYLWFNSGLVFGVVAMVGSVVLLIRTLQQTLAQMTSDNPRMGNQQTLQVVVPGINLPTSQLAYFFMALLLSGVIHELGHAVAALREQVRVNGFGILCLSFIPVRLWTSSQRTSTSYRLFSNSVSSVPPSSSCCPFPVSRVFHRWGALVSEVVQGAAADGPRGLSVGDIVVGLEDCPVKGWRTGAAACLTSLTPHRLDTRLDGTFDCCSNNSLTDLCFSYMKPQGKNSKEREYACMPVRKMVTGTQVCRTDEDCTAHTEVASICVTPSLENQTRFILSLTNFVPRFGFLHLDLPVFLETFCKYVVSLSGALAVVNSVPCFALDGQWMLNALLEATLVTVVTDRQRRELIGFFLLLAGSALLAANVALGLWMPGVMFRENRHGRMTIGRRGQNGGMF
ncbi:hypothetical protein F7725_028805 [Dissostichus mawsoni]|uniref:Membrane-bound transcription factor site-2 protease n=1 Tax=Dissostichus mawsoni TaxID=36200 RepID=A0A7J5XI32_DISMA|nr:hypothetical protein F7725_028805 [Dissostichus mawsoni]